MLTITGYPNVDTVAVKAWTNGTRPSNLTNNYLLGFNTDTNSLEVLNPSSAMVDHISLAQKIALLVYPVGSYYETSDTNFNPNTAWGGEWVTGDDDTYTMNNTTVTGEGRVLISSRNDPGRNLTPGNFGGAETVALVENNIPEHNHPHTHPHTHERGSMNITGYFGCLQQMKERVGGAFNWDQSYTDTTYFCGFPQGQDPSSYGKKMTFNAASSWTGETSEDSTVATGGNFGANPVVGHQNMQPYIVVVRWHRTA